jgi:hypothetical protein
MRTEFYLEKESHDKNLEFLYIYTDFVLFVYFSIHCFVIYITSKVEGLECK